MESSGASVGTDLHESHFFVLHYGTSLDIYDQAVPINLTHCVPALNHGAKLGP